MRSKRAEIATERWKMFSIEHIIQLDLEHWGDYMRGRSLVSIEARLASIE